MNREVLLKMLITNLEIRLEDLYPVDKDPFDSIEDALFELNNRREIYLLKSIPIEKTSAIKCIRAHFQDDVTMCSLYLNHLFPSDFMYYRVSQLEENIFQGLLFLGEDYPSLQFPFAAIGRNGFDRYIEFSKAMMKFAKQLWPNITDKDRQRHLHYLLYQGLGALFHSKTDYNRYWLFVTKEELGSGDDRIRWSARKEMKAGDLVFMYKTAPISAITHVLKAKNDPFFDPWGAWNGFWIDLEVISEIPQVRFSEMKADPVIGAWGSVKKLFAGTVTDPVPHSVYNRLLNFIPESIRTELLLKPEPLAEISSSGSYASEADFEEKVVSDILRRWGFNYQYQFPCRFRTGSQMTHCRVDYLVSDQSGPLTLFENKYKIVSKRNLEEATEQGKSYALMLGLPSFVVCSPEGMWIYSLRRSLEKLEKSVSLQNLLNHKEEEKIRLLLIRLRS